MKAGRFPSMTFAESCWTIASQYRIEGLLTSADEFARTRKSLPLPK
jgi:hypothetical protein